MTIQYTVFDEASGKILRTGTAMSEASALAQGNTPGTRVVLVGSDPEQEQIDPAPEIPAVIPRIPMGVNGTLTRANKMALTANGIDEVMISPIPVGAVAELFLPPNRGLEQLENLIINDGVLYVTTTVPGIYQIKIYFQNLQDFTVTLNAV